MIRKKIFHAVMVLSMLAAASSFGFYHAEGKLIVDSQGNPVQLRGIGLGGWIFPEGYMLHIPGFGSPTSIRQQITDLIGLEGAAEFYQVYEANYLNERDIAQIAAWGFDHIRLPFSYKLFYDPQAEAFREEGFQFFDTFLGWCKAHDLLVVLDMHGAPGGQNAGNISDSDGIEARLWTDTTNQTLTVQIWTEIAARYANEEQILGYDLLNEPVLPQGYSNAFLRDFYIRQTQAIRQVDPNHLVFIEGNWYATDFSQLTPPWDSNMAYSFHKYWSETDQASIQYLLNLRSQFNIPLWMGESGENSSPWFYETVRLFETNNIGWCWWTHKKFATITSPLSVPLTADYQKLLDYWGGQGSKPSVDFAHNALLEMAQNLAFEKCVRVPGVVEALFDPEFGIQPKPFGENVIPGVIAAVDYDLGTQGIAYWDSDYKRTRWDIFQPWNRGFQYRNDGVDIEHSQDSGGPEYSIGWTENGEWLSYQIKALYEGKFDVYVRVASPDDGCKMRMEFNGERIGDDVLIPNTGDYHRWQNVYAGEITAGEEYQTLKVRVVKGGFNFDQLIFKPKEGSGFEEIEQKGYIGPAFPNPANPEIQIPLVLFQETHTELAIYDSSGRLLKQIHRGKLPAGTHLLSWDGTAADGSAAASGIYFYQVKLGETVTAGRITLLR
ncbi:MAG: hypothetical protein Kow0042_27190 [Calditrichia bacterium]